MGHTSRSWGRWPRAYIKVGIGVPWTSQRVLLCYALGRSSQWRLGIRVSPIKKCEAPASHGLVHDFHEARTWAKVRILEGFWAKSKRRSFHHDASCTWISISHLWQFMHIVFFLIPYLRESLWIMSPFSSSMLTLINLCCAAWGRGMAPTSGWKNHIDGSTRRYEDTKWYWKVSGTDWQVAVLNAKVKLLDDRVDWVFQSEERFGLKNLHLIDCITSINDPSLEEDFVHGSDIKNVSWHIVRRGPVLLKKYSQPDTHPNLDLVKERQGPFKDPMSQFPQYFPLLHTFKWPPALCSHCFP